MLAELQEHVHSLEQQMTHAAEEEINSTKATIEYLTACNQLFECGILSHDRVAACNDKVLRSMSQGMHFFYEWAEELLQESESA